MSKHRIENESTFENAPVTAWGWRIACTLYLFVAMCGTLLLVARSYTDPRIDAAIATLPLPSAAFWIGLMLIVLTPAMYAMQRASAATRRWRDAHGIPRDEQDAREDNSVLTLKVVIVFVVLLLAVTKLQGAW